MRAAGFGFLIIAATLTSSIAAAITVPTVPIANPGNPADVRYAGPSHPSGLGSVPYPFSIGTTETTNSQYVAFLNSVAKADPERLYNSSMDSIHGGILRSGTPGNYSYSVKPSALGGSYSYENKPVVFVTWASTLRFANWMHNGQPIGPQNDTTTEDGAYSLHGTDSESSNLATIQRNPGANWWIPNESEWYKAAYYDPAEEQYYDYPTGTNAIPNNNTPATDTSNSANYYADGYTTGDPAYAMTDAGAYLLTASPYGTRDQAGNVFEFVERIFTGSHTAIRGGAYDQSTYSAMHASNWSATFFGNISPVTGFRLATTAIPEPSALALALVGMSVLNPRRGTRRLRAGL